MSIDDIREIPAGTYFEHEGIGYELIDAPTDGPLFRRLDDGFEVQYPTENFEQGDWNRVNVSKALDTVNVEFEASDVEHRFKFTHVENNVWPQSMFQQGEIHHLQLDDVPTFVGQIVEEYTDAELEER